MNRARSTLAIAFVLASSGVASAYNGTVTGKLQFYQHQQDYCPTTRNCTGINYLQSEYNTYEGIAEVQLDVRDANLIIVGRGITNRDGSFTIAWSSPTPVPDVWLYWQPAHKSGAFRVSSPDGATEMWGHPGVGLANGTTTTLAPVRYGTAASPNGIANIYDGAFRTWYYALRYSNLMLVSFTGVTIQPFDTDTNCGTGCAAGWTKTIGLPPGAEYTPQARVMHEMGHIASYLAHPFHWAGNYCWPSTTGSCGWSFRSPEWAAAAFEEGLATFIGDVAINWFAAGDPYTAGLAEEPSDGTSSCATDENRWALNVTKMLWDLYDTHDDGTTATRETAAVTYARFFDALAAWPNGTGVNQIDEPWNTAYSAIDAYDGRSAGAFASVFTTVTGVSASPQRTINCTPN